MTTPPTMPADTPGRRPHSVGYPWPGWYSTRSCTLAMSSRSTTPAPGNLKSRASSASSYRSVSSVSSKGSQKGNKRSSRRRSRRRQHSNASGSSLSLDGSQDRASLAGEKAKASMRGKNQFSKITALIKDKDRRAKKEQPDGADNVVAYVDSARAALTASLGAKDLRGDILKHRHRLKDQEDTDDTESPGFLLLIEQAEWDLNVSYYTRLPTN